MGIVSFIGQMVEEGDVVVILICKYFLFALRKSVKEQES